MIVAQALEENPGIPSFFAWIHAPVSTMAARSVRIKRIHHTDPLSLNLPRRIDVNPSGMTNSHPVVFFSSISASNRLTFQ